MDTNAPAVPPSDPEGNRLQRLEAEVRTLRQRMDDLESAFGMRHVPRPAPPPPPPVTAPQPHVPAPPAPPQQPTPPPRPVVAPPRPVMPARQVVPPRPAPRADAPEGFEAEIALKWLGRIGAVALIVAAAFFLQHAFANHWIGPEGQFACGIVAAVALLLIGERNRRKDRPALAEAMMGGGVALLYICVYSAYALYRPPLLDQLPAFALMALVTAVGVAIAVYANALSMAVIATLGGFLTPVLIRGHGGPGEAYGTMVNLFGYLIVLDLGLLALGLFKRWRALQLLSLIATWLVVWGWLADVQDRQIELASVGPMTILFLVFALMPAMYGWWQRAKTDEYDMAIILINPVAFFPTAAMIVSQSYNHVLGAAAVALALLYFVLTGAAWRINRSDNLLTLAWLSLGATFVTVAVPLQFDGLWVLLAWGLEGALLIAVGVALNSLAVRAIGGVLQGVVAVWTLLAVMLYGGSLGADNLPFTNRVFLSCLGAALTLLATYLIYTYAPPANRRQETAQVRGAALFWLGLLLLALPTMEASRAHLDGRNMFVWWALCGPTLVALAAVREGRAAAILGVLAQGIVLFWTLGIWSFYGHHGVLAMFANGNFALFLLGLLSVGSLYALARVPAVDELLGQRSLHTLLPPLLAFMGLWGLTAEINHNLASFTGGKSERGFVVSLLWCVYATALVATGLWKRNVPLRAMGVGLFGIAILKVFLVDAWGLGGIWRVLSFVCLGVILLGVSYLYHLYGERLREFMRGEAPAAEGDGEGADYKP